MSATAGSVTLIGSGAGAVVILLVLLARLAQRVARLEGIVEERRRQDRQEE